jgi:hypothetical protein
MSKERLYLFDTTLRGPFARSREAASTNNQVNAGARNPTGRP